MGWLSMTRSGMATFATPKAYLDNQCTYTPDPEKGRDKGLRVLKSTVRSNAYYAACQSYTADGPLQTFAIICLIKWNPAAREGYLFDPRSSGATRQRLRGAVARAMPPASRAHHAAQTRPRRYSGPARGADVHRWPSRTQLPGRASGQKGKLAPGQRRRRGAHILTDDARVDDRSCAACAPCHMTADIRARP